MLRFEDCVSTAVATLSDLYDSKKRVERAFCIESNKTKRNFIMTRKGYCDSTCMYDDSRLSSLR